MACTVNPATGPNTPRIPDGNETSGERSLHPGGEHEPVLLWANGNALVPTNIDAHGRSETVVTARTGFTVGVDLANDQAADALSPLNLRDGHPAEPRRLPGSFCQRSRERVSEAIAVSGSSDSSRRACALLRLVRHRLLDTHLSLLDYPSSRSTGCA